MIVHLGASAIAAAVGLKPETIRAWRKAQLRGETPPIPLKVAKNGMVWCSAEDVLGFFFPAPSGDGFVEAAMAKSLAVVDQQSTTRERGCHRSTDGRTSANAAERAQVTTARRGGSGQSKPILGAQVP